MIFVDWKTVKNKAATAGLFRFYLFMEMGLVENQDFGMINDACLTELTPELFIEKSLKKITNAWSNFLDLSRILMKTAKEDAPLEM